MRCPERGMALVTVLFLLTLLLVMALLFSDKVTRAIRNTTRTAARDQALQAAGAGIEWARPRRAASYAASSGWADYLAGAPAGDRYPATPAFSTVVGRVTVDIFLRDNADGDDDPQRDNDLKLRVLARARSEGGPAVLVESLCGFTAGSAGYRQAGGGSGRSGATADSLDRGWSAPAATFAVRD